MSQSKEEYNLYHKFYMRNRRASTHKNEFRDRYKKYKDVIVIQRKVLREDRILFVNNIKLLSSCVSCGNSDVRVLEFHHRSPSIKKSNISAMVHSLTSRDKILTEINKCDVLCVNCHRIMHGMLILPPVESKKKLYFWELKLGLRFLKESQGCSICGMRNGYCLDYHHVDPKTKKKEVGLMAGNSFSISTIMKEIAKCIVLCSNCHRIHHDEC